MIEDLCSPRRCRKAVPPGSVAVLLSALLLLLAAPVQATSALQILDQGGPLLASDIESDPTYSTGLARAPRASDLTGGALTTGSPPAQPGGLAGTWRAIKGWGITRRVISVGSWVSSGVRVLWAIPKAIVKGDSHSLIEAIGELLARASTEAQGEAEPRAGGAREYPTPPPTSD